MNKFVPIGDAALEDVLKHATKGPWALASTEKNDFYIHRFGILPLQKVLEFQYGISGYDMRLMSLSCELAAEVLYLRKKLRELESE